MKEYLINRNDTLAFPVPNMNTGMTLRDYFAAKALQGMSANPADVHDADQETYDEYVKEISRCAYKMADAMMKAREA
jgi:hypothetical protein